MYKVITTTLLVCSSFLSFGQQYTFKANAPTARSAMACAVVNVGVEQQTPKILVCGGSVSGVSSSIVEEYDVLTDTWSTKAPLPFAILEGFAATVNGKVYVIGGYGSGGAIDKVQEYNPATNTWSIKSPMPTSRSQLSGAVINNKIYVTGGWPGEFQQLEIYDPLTDTWTTGASSLYGIVQNNAGVNFNNQLYIFGGKNYPWNAIYDYNMKYDPQLNTWTSMAPMPAPRFSGAAVNYNGSIRFFGGAITSWMDNYNTHFNYDPTLNVWSYGLPLPIRLVSHVAAVANNKVYIIGGSDSNGFYSNKTIEYSETLLNINDQTTEAKVYCYVSNGQLHVKGLSANTQSKITVYDMTGKIILTSSNNNGEMYLGVLARGTYVAHVQAGNMIYRNKFLY